MRLHRSAWVVLAFTVALGGCKPGQFRTTGGEIIEAPEGSLSVYDLAGRLGLDVVEATPASVYLRNHANSVMIFPDPGGRAYVNGKPVGPVGGVAVVGDTMFVPVAVEGHVRSVLRSHRISPVKTTVGTFTPPPRSVPPKRRERIVIDPGHGGRDPGTSSRTGEREKHVNLTVAREVARRLKQRGFDVRLTRGDDRFIELNDRAAVSNKLRAARFVSIHADHCPNPAIRGYSVYVSRSASAKSLATAASISRAMRRTGMTERGLRRSDFRVLVRTRCPAVLVELGFMSNSADLALLLDRGCQQRLAEAIAQGIADSFDRQGQSP